MIVPRDRPRDRPASAQVSAIQNAATAARQRAGCSSPRAPGGPARRRNSRRPRRTFASPSWASTRASRRRRRRGEHARRETFSPTGLGRSAFPGIFPRPRRWRLGVRAKTENRKPIAANRGSPAPSRLARPASAGVPRWFTESVAAVAELPATPRGAFRSACAAPPGTTWRRPSPSRRRRGGARRLSARGSKNRDGWRPRARAREESRRLRSRVRRRVSRRRLTSRDPDRTPCLVARPRTDRG